MGVMNTYEVEYERLNHAQKQVLEHTSGPLLVVAGAGTGKTHTITQKISKLLQEGVESSRILAITFTEKAASEMLERVMNIQQGLLLDLPIMTYNGFGDSLLREFGIDIGLPRSFRLLTPQAQIVFVRERIDEFDLDYFMPLTSSPDGIIEDMLKFFSKLKQHIVTPETYQKYADDLPKGDKAEQLDKLKHSELARAYETYIHLCRIENVIDYDDQIYLTIQLLEQRPNIQKLLKKRYHTIFVDEFQDTNPMQSRLIDLILPESRNLVVVGDDDQAIYGFRGATIANILSFKDRYPDTAEAVLTVNYRSHQSILDAAYNLIQKNNPDRLEASLGLNKRLTSDMPGSKPQLLRFGAIREELGWLTTDIADRVSNSKSDNISIAVLTRSNNSAQMVHQALEVAGIPHRVVGLNPDLYTRPVVRMLLELVRTIVEPDNNVSLHHTLISDLFGVSNKFIAPLARQARYEHESLENILAEREETKDAIAILRALRTEAANTSVGMLLWKAVVETGYKEKLLKAAPGDDTSAVAVGYLSQFFDSLKDFENIATQPTAVQYMLALPALKAAGETTDDTLGLNELEVIVTTVHKAKGLEWDTVYLPRLTEQTFPMWKQGGGIELAEALRVGSASQAEEHYAEERRVMYVAVTRARKNLLLSWSDGSRKPSRFIDEMFGAGTTEALEISEAVSTQAGLEVAAEQQPVVDIPSRIYDGIKVRLSVSQAQVLLNCPLNFQYKFVFGAPEEPTVSTSYGSYMHGFIEEINRARKEKRALRPLTVMLDDLQTGWEKAGYASKAQRERALTQAKETLTNYYHLANSSPAPITVEDKFEATLPGDIVIHGRLDAVYASDNGIEIRDYKTGYAVRDADDAKKKARESKQLTLYALAWQAIHGELPDKVTLHYVDTGLLGSASRQQRSIDTLHTNLTKAIDNLKQGIFLPSGRHDFCIHPPVNELP
jgi:DNA helicase II / ATP-dependent DNA helicase PcrA